MKLGIFDSGLGGLLIAKAVRDKRPDIDMVYLGDTLHVPYGSRSQEAIYQYSRRAVDYLFRKKDCRLIVLACNTASASALRRLQQEYLPAHYPERRILGVIVPTLEIAQEKGYKRIGLLATNYLVQSGIYKEELEKIGSDIKLFQQAAPLLVPMIENGGKKWIEPVLKDYLDVLLANKIECLILGCTHYPYLKTTIQKLIPPGIKILSQDEIIPVKLSDYLNRHPEINEKIGKSGHTTFLVTDITENYIKSAQDIYEDSIGVSAVAL